MWCCCFNYYYYYARIGEHQLPRQEDNFQGSFSPSTRWLQRSDSGSSYVLQAPLPSEPSPQSIVFVFFFTVWWGRGCVCTQVCTYRSHSKIWSVFLCPSPLHSLAGYFPKAETHCSSQAGQPPSSWNSPLSASVLPCSSPLPQMVLLTAQSWCCTVYLGAGSSYSSLHS